MNETQRNPLLMTGLTPLERLILLVTSDGEHRTISEITSETGSRSRQSIYKTCYSLVQRGLMGREADVRDLTYVRYWFIGQTVPAPSTSTTAPTLLPR